MSDFEERLDRVLDRLERDASAKFTTELYDLVSEVHNKFDIRSNPSVVLEDIYSRYRDRLNLYHQRLIGGDKQSTDSSLIVLQEASKILMACVMLLREIDA